MKHKNLLRTDKRLSNINNTNLIVLIKIEKLLDRLNRVKEKKKKTNLDSVIAFRLSEKILSLRFAQFVCVFRFMCA